MARASGMEDVKIALSVSPLCRPSWWPLRYRPILDALKTLASDYSECCEGADGGASSCPCKVKATEAPTTESVKVGEI